MLEICVMVLCLALGSVVKKVHLDLLINQLVIGCVKPLWIFLTNQTIIFKYHRLFPINYLTVPCPFNDCIPLFTSLVPGGGP